MRVLFLHQYLRKSGVTFLRSRYFVEDLEARGHEVWLANFITDDPTKYDTSRGDIISTADVSRFRPDVVLIELGAFSTGPRIPSRQWLDQSKLEGCIVVHCGLDYNEYDSHRPEYDGLFSGFGMAILKKKSDVSGTEELPNIRGSEQSQVARTDVDALKKYCSLQDESVFRGVAWVESHHALVIDPRSSVSPLGHNALLVAGPQSSIKAYNDWQIHGESNAIYGAFSDRSGIEVLITGHFVTDGRERKDREQNRIFLINVLEYLHTYNPVTYRRPVAQQGLSITTLEADTSPPLDSDCAVPQPGKISVEVVTPNTARASVLAGLMECFTRPELMALGSELGASFAEPSFDANSDVHSQVLSLFERSGRLRTLIEYCRLVHPEFAWPHPAEFAHSSMSGVRVSLSLHDENELQSLSMDLLESLLMRERLGVEFDLPHYPSPAEDPPDSDVPHIICFWCSSFSPHRGEVITVLFRVVDSGRDLAGAESIKVVDTVTGAQYRAFRQGRGFYACRIPITGDSRIGSHVIEFRLADSKGKSHTQSIRIDVQSRTPATTKSLKDSVHRRNQTAGRHTTMTSILFLAGDPTDASRLRLGAEFREIQEKLRLAKLRHQFRLELPQLAVRPSDISQSLLDLQPQIVHFSGHGAASGALCFEDAVGNSQLVRPDALAALFEQFAGVVDCVLLNACYSEPQAKAIAEHIRVVIGMNQAIGDKAAIAFTIGFYQALGAGRTVNDAYQLGCIQIRLQGIPEHLTPVLVQSSKQSPGIANKSREHYLSEPIKLVESKRETISIDVVITRTGQRHTVEVALDTLVRYAEEKLIEVLALPRKLENEWPIAYHLYSKTLGKKLDAGSTFRQNGVGEGDTLSFHMEALAG
ncbi:MAG: CHAT domain-containing protein [Anaerolineales bacterium]|nr:CHAT domain-containing protein [Anaerolineales bacterium]